MQIGMIGLGRMGSNMVRRLMQAGHAGVVHDANTAAVEALRNQGAMGTASLEDFVTRMAKPRAIWLMLPATVVDKVLTQLLSDSGEGRWTALAAIDEGVPIPVISTALFERFASRDDADYANRVLSAMRKQFGGHDEKKAER